VVDPTDTTNSAKKSKFFRVGIIMAVPFGSLDADHQRKFSSKTRERCALEEGQEDYLVAPAGTPTFLVKSSRDYHVVYGKGSSVALSYASKSNITAAAGGKPDGVYRKYENRDALATHLGYFLQNRVMTMTEALEMLYRTTLILSAPGSCSQH